MAAAPYLGLTYKSHLKDVTSNDMGEIVARAEAYNQQHEVADFLSVNETLTE